MKKKLMVKVLAAAVCMVLLAACTANAGGSVQVQENETEEPEEEEEEPQVLLPADAVIGICRSAEGSAYEDAYYARLQRYLEKNGFAADHIVTVEAEHGQERAAVLSLVGSGSGILLVDCGAPENAQAIRKLATDIKIPLIFIMTEPEEAELALWEGSDWSVAYVGGDRSRIGELREMIIDAVPFEDLDASGDHFIGCLVLDGADKSSEGVAANKGTLEAMEADHYKPNVLKHAVMIQTPEDEDPDAGAWSLDADIEIIPYETFDDAVEEIGSLLKEYKGDVEVILCAEDTMARAAAQALSDNRRRVGHDVQILGTEATKESLEAVAAGEIRGTVFNDYLAQSRKAADAALAFWKGEKVPYHTYCDYVKVTADNAKEILDVAEESLEQEEAEEEAGDGEETEE